MYYDKLINEPLIVDKKLDEQFLESYYKQYKRYPDTIGDAVSYLSNIIAPRLGVSKDTLESLILDNVYDNRAFLYPYDMLYVGILDNLVLNMQNNPFRRYIVKQCKRLERAPNDRH